MGETALNIDRYDDSSLISRQEDEDIDDTEYWLDYPETELKFEDYFESVDLKSARDGLPVQSHNRVETSDGNTGKSAKIPRGKVERVIQEWEGEIICVENDVVTAVLTDLTNGKGQADTEADIPLVEFDSRDKDQIVPGSIFRWTISYVSGQSQGQRRQAHIFFRDIPTLHPRSPKLFDDVVWD